MDEAPTTTSRRGGGGGGRGETVGYVLIEDCDLWCAAAEGGGLGGLAAGRSPDPRNGRWVDVRLVRGSGAYGGHIPLKGGNDMGFGDGTALAGSAEDGNRPAVDEGPCGGEGEETEEDRKPAAGPSPSDDDDVGEMDESVEEASTGSGIDLDQGSLRNICGRCDLLLRLSGGSDEVPPASPSQSAELTLDVGSVAPFDGTETDMKARRPPPPSSESGGVETAGRFCSPLCRRTRRRNAGNRSDAALLLGLAFRCEDLGHVGVRSARVLLHPSNGKGERNASSGRPPESGGDDAAALSPGVWRRRAALLVTFSCAAYDACTGNAAPPPIHSSPSPRSGGRRKAASSGRKSSPLDVLPPSVQLLYSLLRSDWDRLDFEMDRLRWDCSGSNTGAARGGRRSETLFPPELSLEQLYRRILGANRHLLEDDCDSEELLGAGSCDTRGCSTPSEFRPLSDTSYLPKEVLIDRIAPYLRARSLDSLRRSSRYLRRTLRSVIPGLKLRLYRHQVASLEWMRRREAREMTEEDVLRAPAAGEGNGGRRAGSGAEEDGVMCGDLHRAATGGATARLAPRGGRERRTCVDRGSAGGGGVPLVLRLDTRTGVPHPVDARRSSSNSPGGADAHGAVRRLRRVARGGLLCDDPGLGKTVTVMSLVLQTLGQSTEPPAGVRARRHSDEDLFRAYWAEALEEDVGRKPALSRLLGQLRRSDGESFYFDGPVDPSRDECPDYFDIVSRPMCIRDIREKVGAGVYGADLEAFQADVELCFRNAMLYNPPEHIVHQAAKRLTCRFAELIEAFKAEHLRTATKSFSNLNANPDSSIAAMLAERARDDLVDSLVASSATLLVVPNTLLAHWEEQIMMHIDFSYCSNKTPIIYRHSIKKTRSSGISLDNLQYLTRTHIPLIFIDESVSKPLPAPEVLSMFRVVVTTAQRLISEWKYGSFEEEMEMAKEGGAMSYREVYLLDPEDMPAASSLLKVHWLRLVVDEGHSMGRGVSNSFQFASWITAQRRWAMTGTPTQQTASSTGLRNVHGLMSFLKHDFFRPILGGNEVWARAIARGWNEGRLASFFRLRSLLSLLMVRHTKKNIEEIPPPVFIRTYIDLSQQETITYNTLVSAVESNIVLTTMEGSKTSAWQDSLLNPSQTRNANEALTNLRLVCSGSLRMLPTVKDAHWAETLDMLRTKHACDEVKVTLCHNYLHRATTGELSSCMSCGIQVQTLFVVPCGDLVCTQCIDNKSKACPVCKNDFDADDFQRLQPGMTYTWVHNLEEEKRKRESRARLKRQLSVSRRNEAVSDEAEDEEVDFDEESVDDRELDTIVMPQMHQRRVHTCTYSQKFFDGKCETCQEEHFDCNFMNEKLQCPVCFKRAEDSPEHASKATYVIEKLLKLLSAYSTSSGSRCLSMAASRFVGEAVLPEMQQPLKVIIFSQYRSILDYFGDRIIRRFGGSCVAEYWGATRQKELMKFAKSTDCFCMLLSKEGSHGLDLSFVTHIFFLDTIYDKSLESQVVARAYRMGAKAHVTVEQLVAKETVEELILQLSGRPENDFCEQEHASMNDGVESCSSNKDDSFLPSHSVEEKQAKKAKLHFLLKNVRLMKAKKHMIHGNTAGPPGDRKRVRIRF